MRLLPLLLVPVLSLTACGSDEDPTLSAPTPTTGTTSAAPVATSPATSSGDVQVIARDYSFSGLDITPKAGDTLSITMRNTGQRPHDLEITGPDGAVAGGVDTIDGGESKSASVALRAAGVYTYVCTIGSHAELGMKGSFTVSS